MQLADEENVPAYIIFSDSTLQELAAYLPLSMEDLEKISGFGAVKMQKYGAAFLEVVKKYCEANGLASRIDTKKPKRQRKAARKKVSATKLESLEMLKAGNSIQEIAEKRDLSSNTIETHLAEFVLEGGLAPTALLSQELYEEISKAFEGYDDLALRPIKEKLREDITYGQIRIVQYHLQYLASRKDSQENNTN